MGSQQRVEQRKRQTALAKHVEQEECLQLSESVSCKLDRQVEFLQPNPKVAGRDAARRYGRYMTATTIGEALRLGAFPNDLKYDYSKKQLRLVNGGRVLKAALPSYARRPPKNHEALDASNAAQLLIGGISCWVPLTQAIEFVAANPKEVGSLARQRYAKYRAATTVGQALRRSAAKGDLTFDVQHKFAKFPGGLVAEPLGQVAVACADRSRVSKSLPSYRARAKRLTQQLRGKARKQMADVREAIAAKVETYRERALGRCAGRDGNKRKRGTPLPHKSANESRSNYALVVPSFPHDQRINILRSHTLKLLEKQGVPYRRINLVVADKQEKRRYAKSLRGRMPTILVAKKGIVQVREWIVRHFPAGKHILSMDDDVSDICWLPKGREQLQSLPSGGLDKLVSAGEHLMKQEGAFLWALNASDQARNLKDQVSRRLGLANGSFYGFINRPSCKKLSPCLGSAAEDCERSLRFFQHDKVMLRFQGYAAKTEPYHNAGGLLTEFRSSAQRKVAVYQSSAE